MLWRHRCLFALLCLYLLSALLSGVYISVANRGKITKIDEITADRLADYNNIFPFATKSPLINEPKKTAPEPEFLARELFFPSVSPHVARKLAD